MSTSTPFTRRQFLARTAATVAVGATLSPAVARATALPERTIPTQSAALDSVSIDVTDLEVLTATPTTLTFAWSTFRRPHTDHLQPGERIPSDAEVWLAPVGRGQKLKRVHRSTSRTGFHFITITGLKPDTLYRFSCRSFGKEASPGLWFTNVTGEPEGTKHVRTSARPKGRHLQTVAICNDIHIGMKSEVDGNRKWPSVMVSSMLSELKRRGINRVYVNGDVCDEGVVAEAREMRRIFDQFGEYNRDYFFTRGNHDAYAMQGFTDPDPIRTVFPEHPLQKMWVTKDRKLRVIGLDSSWPGLGSGKIGDAQFQQLERELARDPHTPTLVMAHHPVTTHAAMSDIRMRNGILDKDDSIRLQKIFQKAPGVFFMAAGHTHRAHRDRPDFRDGPEFCQFCCATPYPGGYTLMDFYEGGYTVAFHRTATGQALKQTAQNRYDMFYGFYGEYTISRMRNRCFTVMRDMSALR